MKDTGHHSRGGHSDFINVRTYPNYGVQKRRRGILASGFILITSTVAVLVYVGLFFKTMLLV